jgi:hypothetical protein
MPQVGAVELEQVEGEHESAGLVPPLAQDLEHGQAALVAAHSLAVDQAGPHLQVVHGLDDEREAGGPVVASARDQPNADRVAPGHQAIAVVLDLMNPVRARRLVGRRWQARFDEAGGGSAGRRTQRGHDGVNSIR